MDAASYVNQARRAAGLSQRELAARSGVPQPAIARIEKGKQVPRADTLARLLDPCGFELRLGPKRGEGVDELTALRDMIREQEESGSQQGCRLRRAWYSR